MLSPLNLRASLRFSLIDRIGTCPPPPCLVFSLSLLNSPCSWTCSSDTQAQGGSQVPLFRFYCTRRLHTLSFTTRRSGGGEGGRDSMWASGPVATRRYRDHCGPWDATPVSRVWQRRHPRTLAQEIQMQVRLRLIVNQWAGGREAPQCTVMSPVSIHIGMHGVYVLRQDTTDGANSYRDRYKPH